jgi:hypothetical protein
MVYGYAYQLGRRRRRHLLRDGDRQTAKQEPDKESHLVWSPLWHAEALVKTLIYQG